MGLLRWFTKNWANTQEPTHRDLTPLVVPFGYDPAIELLKKAVATLPNWQFSPSPASGELRLTRQTGIMAFVDDIVLTLNDSAGATTIHAASRSRVGVGDLGQNRRNILELWDAIRRELKTGS